MLVEIWRQFFPLFLAWIFKFSPFFPFFGHFLIFWSFFYILSKAGWVVRVKKWTIFWGENSLIVAYALPPSVHPGTQNSDRKMPEPKSCFRNETKWETPRTRIGNINRQRSDRLDFSFWHDLKYSFYQIIQNIFAKSKFWADSWFQTSKSNFLIFLSQNKIPIN